MLEATASTMMCGEKTLRIEAATQYGGAVATAINKLKHRDRPDLARPLGDLVRRRWRTASAPWVVPVPLHPLRLAERGYNQSALLARAMAKGGSAKVRFDVLRRRLPTASQQGLSASARRRNVADAFELTADVRGRRVVLVDDVCTTGATLAACAQVMFDGGAAEVGAQVVARRHITSP